MMASDCWMEEMTADIMRSSSLLRFFSMMPAEGF
jgi:hypothetical protein